jgi:hypothetical protein
MQCSFRLYGDFVWPPVPGAVDGSDRRQGLVEIYFESFDPPGGKPGRQRAFLRWRPGQVIPSADEVVVPPESGAHIFDLDSAAEWFAAHGDTELSLWIYGQKPNKKGPVLAVRGGFLFEQLATTSDGSISRLRWPLVRSASYGEDLQHVLSELVVGQPHDPQHPGTRDNFRFNLQLPMLFGHTRTDSVAVPVFPFSVLYNSDVATASAATLFDTLTVGPRGADFIVRHEPTTPRLGAFGFAPSRGGGQGDYAGYVDDAADDSGATKKLLDRYWPRADAAGSCLALLGAIGIDIPASARPRLPRSGPTNMSFRPGAEPGSSDNHYVSRLTFTAPSGTGSAGDLFWEGGEFYLRLEEELGGYLKLKQLHVDCILQFAIPDAAIWGGYAAWSASISLRPHWQSSLGTAPLGEGPTPLFQGRPVFSAGTLPDGANAMRLALADLYRVEASQPQSFLPDLAVPHPQKPRFALYAPPLPASFDADGAVQFARKPPVSQPTPLRLSLLDDRHLIKPEAPQVLHLAARMPSFFVGAPVTLPFHLFHDAAWSQVASWQAVTDAQDQPYFASFAIGATATPGADAPRLDWTGRLSSIEFAAQAAPLNYGDGHLRLGGRGMGNRGHHPVSGVAGFPHPIAVSLQYQLPFTGALPVGVDIRRGANQSRTTPLLIETSPSGSGGDADGARFRLAVRERLAPVGDRQLQAEVFEDNTDSGDKTYVVIAEEPFSINRFSSRVLGGRGDAGSGSVAFYSSDIRLWEFRQVAQYYRYSFPPQAVGESADKPRRLEIHDLPERAGGGAAPERPYAPGPGGEQDALRRRAVEFRLTPSAEIWIRPSDVERGYFTPEWNSHEIFRQRGELGLGAALAWLRAEFLYGLPVGIEVGKERGVSRRARIAEIEALTGTLLGTADSPLPFAALWNALAGAIARRPERLEVWADDPASVLDFAPARFSDGASFALRETALLRAPKLRDTPTGPAESEADYTALPVRRGGLRYHPQGLSGGALWPVESANLFDALADSPLASGGEIENIALSPLGGDAAQKALFLDGKVSIITRTRNGFIERQQVEVIGRIGALWHRAKHVVVYERTVNPSAQFAPTYEEDSDRTRTRRPVLRKVREYIELLQPERAYPDFAQASARSAGFLDRVRFNARIINVDSAWSRDVGKDGWEIPLWNRKAARQRPQVYPMPDVAFVSVAEGDGERPLVAQECRDPDNLYFFADFAAPGADTDLWPQRLAVDYANLPSASIIAAQHDQRSAAGNGDGRRQPVSRILPGLRRFTWRLAPSARKVALNAGRAAKPLYVGLESISFMRAGQEGRDASPFQPLAALLAKSAAAAGQGAIAAPAYWGADPSKAIFDHAASFSQAVTTMRQALDSKAPDAIETARQALQASLAALAGEAAGKVGGAAGAIKDAIKPVRDAALSVKHVTDQGKADCDRLKADALGGVRRKAMLVEALLRDWEADLGSALDIAGLPGTKAELIAGLADAIIAASAPAFAAAAGGVADIGERVEQARAIVDDVEAEADASIGRTVARVRQYAAAYDRDKPWSDERRRAFYAGLEAAAAGLADDLLATIDEARQRLSTELDDIGQQIAGHVAAALREFYARNAQGLGEVATFHAAARKVLGSARSAIKPLLPPDQGGDGKLGDLLVKLATARLQVEKSGASTQIKQQVLGALAALEATLAEIAVQGRNAVDLIDAAAQYGDAFDRRLTAAITRLNALVWAIADAATARVADLIAAAKALAQEGQAEVAAVVQQLLTDFETDLAAVGTQADRYITMVGEPIDAIATGLSQGLLDLAVALRRELAEVARHVDTVAGDVADAIAGAREMLAPGALLDTVVRQAVVLPTLETVLAPLPDTFSLAALRGEILSRLADISATIAEKVRTIDAAAAGAIGDVSAICNLVFEGAGTALDYFDSIVDDAEQYANDQVAAATAYFANAVGATPEDLEKALNDLRAVDQTVRNLQNDLARSVETASAYGNRVLDAAGKLTDGGLMAAPSNILKLYSAATSAPEIAALKADIDRLRANFDDLSDVIKTTKANALFDRLGDELKAMGLSLPFDSISDRLLPVDLSSFDISGVFRNFGGLKLDRLFKGYKLPQGVKDAVRISHDFDKQQARAWVQVDIDAPMPGRRNLFSLGLFQADFVDMQLTGQVRFEVSKDSDTITQTGHARIGTLVDLVVGGQSMVRFEKFGLNFTKESGLDIEFDPKNIRINPAFRFIQEFLATLFPDEAGGLNIIKQDGIPVGIEHEFAIPPISLNFATSGVSNIAITNRFQLLAYPDFVLANRFNLSRQERPFIFSIFVIGGTGYVQVDAEYRPFENELMVAVEAAAGGSASLAFAFGPFVGQVFITLSISLSFRKLIGRSGGRLSVGVVLVIAGHVNVAGIVTAGIVLMLRMTYRDSGQIDADGTLSVTIRISRFFKITARAGVQYKLRGGKSETTTSSGVGVEADGQLGEAAKKLQEARA